MTLETLRLSHTQVDPTDDVYLNFGSDNIIITSIYAYLGGSFSIIAQNNPDYIVYRKTATSSIVAVDLSSTPIFLFPLGSQCELAITNTPAQTSNYSFNFIKCSPNNPLYNDGFNLEVGPTTLVVSNNFLFSHDPTRKYNIKYVGVTVRTPCAGNIFQLNILSGGIYYPAGPEIAVDVPTQPSDTFILNISDIILNPGESLELFNLEDNLQISFCISYTVLPS